MRILTDPARSRNYGASRSGLEERGGAPEERDITIDFHTHVDAGHPGGLRDTAATLLSTLDAAGIGQAVCTTYREVSDIAPDVVSELVAEVAPHRKRLIPFARLDPRNGNAVDRLRDAVTRLGCAGLKLHPRATGCSGDHPGTRRLVAEAARLGVPVLFHSGDDESSRPLHLAAAAEGCPAGAIVFGHMGGYRHVDEAITVAVALPNVYLETSAMPYPDKIATAVARLGAHRVLFGSDAPRASARVEHRKVELAELSAADRATVTGQSALRLLDA